MFIGKLYFGGLSLWSADNDDECFSTVFMAGVTCKHVSFTRSNLELISRDSESILLSLLVWVESLLCVKPQKTYKFEKEMSSMMWSGSVINE